MVNPRKVLYKNIVLGLIKISPDSISNYLYLKNIHWIRRIKRSKSQDIYIDLSLISLKLLDSHINSFVKTIKKKLKKKKDNQYVILDFTKTCDVSYNFIKGSTKRLVESKIITEDLYEDNHIIILGSEEIKKTFTKYFKYYLSQT